MFSPSAVLEQLILAGVTGNALVTAMRALEDSSVQQKSAGAIRQQRYRDKQKEAAPTVTEPLRDVTSDAKKEIPHTPLEKTTTTKNQPTRATAEKKTPTLFPDDFKLSEKNFEVATAHGFTPAAIDVEIERMRNWSKNAHGGKGKKLNWQSFAFNWFTEKRKPNAIAFTPRPTPASKLADAFAEQRAGLVERFGEPDDDYRVTGSGF